MGGWPEPPDVFTHVVRSSVRAVVASTQLLGSSAAGEGSVLQLPLLIQAAQARSVGNGTGADSADGSAAGGSGASQAAWTVEAHTISIGEHACMHKLSALLRSFLPRRTCLGAPKRVSTCRLCQACLI